MTYRASLDTDSAVCGGGIETFIPALTSCPLLAKSGHERFWLSGWGLYDCAVAARKLINCFSIWAGDTGRSTVELSRAAPGSRSCPWCGFFFSRSPGVSRVRKKGAGAPLSSDTGSGSFHCREGRVRGRLVHTPAPAIEGVDWLGQLFPGHRPKPVHFLSQRRFVNGDTLIA